MTWKMLRSICLSVGSNAWVSEKPISFFFLARNAIYYGLKALEMSPGENILVPSYICAAVVEPMLTYGVKVKFYDIYPDCSPNFDDLQAKIDPNTRALLAVHYFGFPQSMRSFRDLCTNYHLSLIEDCAHVFIGESAGNPLGSWGDISIYSWRKFLPLYDGGQLVINNPKLSVKIPWHKESPLLRVKVAKNLVDKCFADSTHPLARVACGLLDVPHTIVRSLRPSLGRSQATVVTADGNSVDFDLSLVNMPMSSLSRRLLYNADIPSIVQHRRLNYAYLLDAVQALPGVVPLFSDLSPGVCPLVFPVLVQERPDFHLKLRARGLPAVTWGGVVPPALSREEFPTADYLYQNLISLPVHQSLNSADLQMIVQVLAEALRY
jgi:dTDP-4-amino-4,6-dideoxygalactose transaminase